MRKVILLVILPFLMLAGKLQAQNVFDPNDPIVNFNPAAPPVYPPHNVMAKWVRTPRMSWNTDKFKCYYWNGIAFRLRFPTNYDPSNPNKKYPVILFFHGGGEIGAATDNEFHLLLGAQMFEKMMDNGQFDAFMIFPQTQSIAWEESQFLRLNNIIDSLVKYCRADDDRVIPMGLSIGGNGALWYSQVYPEKAAASIPSSPAFISTFGNSSVDKFIHVPVWVASGLADNNPDPFSVRKFVDTFAAHGGSVQSFAYPNVGHASWDLQWKEPELVQYWNNAHKANPLVFFQRNQIPQDSTIQVKIGITGVYYSYEWQRNGVTVATGTNGANVILDPNSIMINTGNEITVKSYGDYRVRFKKSASAPWSEWSPKPAVITAGPIARAYDANIDLPYATILDGRKSTAAAGSTIVKYQWAKISGPASYYVLNPDQAATWINSVTKGLYIFRLTVTDDKGRTSFTDMRLTVNDGTVNKAPTAKPGNNQNIALPINTVTLDGTGSSAAPGLTLTSYAWSKVSGPAQGTIVSPNAATTAVNNLAAGVYVFRLTVTDNSTATSSGDVTITVTNAVNPPPTANAGSNQTITLPTNAVTLNGTASSAATGKTLTGYFWQKISGPAAFTLVTPTLASTQANGLSAGTYVFRLTVTDNTALSTSADVTITVTAANAPPTANAGSNQTITLPTNTVTLNGTGSSAATGKTLTGYFWQKISGPTAFTLVTPTLASTQVNGLNAGTYVFRLTVTDNAALSTSADVTITVNGPVETPLPGGTTANAGPDVSFVSSGFGFLNGTGSAAGTGRTLTSTVWTRVSGPSQYYMTSPTSIGTFLKYMVKGVYVFRLTVTDNQGGTATDDVVATVTDDTPTPPTGPAPVAKAGSNLAITLPVNDVLLDGSGSTASAGSSITNYAWSKVSGPAQSTITTPATVSTTVTNLVAGTYIFRLTVTDNNGLTGTADVTVTVNPVSVQPGTPPVANAGDDQTMLASSFGFLNGTKSAAAPGSTIVTTVWTKVTGAEQYYMTSANSIGTFLKYMVIGVYTFRLTITDDKGQIGTDDVVVNVVNTMNSGLTNNLSPVNENILQVEAEKFSLYPNPATDFVNLKWQSSYRGNATIHIYDFSGRRMQTVSVKKEQGDYNNRINVSNLKKGMYYLEIYLPGIKTGIRKTFLK